ncbi:hypothetical protein Mpsy_3125 [Methanolobus psychrophilus R15]|nr:hypothetical protein Mpsy_3125 [Methanolobus psychrophilus R15]
MQKKSIAWALRVHTENPDIVKHWSQSSDIIEKALANAIREAVEGQR